MVVLLNTWVKVIPNWCPRAGQPSGLPALGLSWHVCSLGLDQPMTYLGILFLKPYPRMHHWYFWAYYNNCLRMSNMSKILLFSVSSDFGLLRLRGEVLFLTLWKNIVVWIRRIPCHLVASLSALKIEKEFPCSIEAVASIPKSMMWQLFAKNSCDKKQLVVQWKEWVFSVVIQLFSECRDTPCLSLTSEGQVPGSHFLVGTLSILIRIWRF